MVQIASASSDSGTVPESVRNLPSLLTDLDIRMHAPEDIAKEGFEHIKWYDHEDHIHFDVCADDQAGSERFIFFIYHGIYLNPGARAGQYTA